MVVLFLSTNEAYRSQTCCDDRECSCLLMIVCCYKQNIICQRLKKNSEHELPISTTIIICPQQILNRRTDLERVIVYTARCVHGTIAQNSITSSHIHADLNRLIIEQNFCKTAFPKICVAIVGQR